MGRGISAGGGQSSLGYLFNSEKATSPQPPPTNTTIEPTSQDRVVNENEHTPSNNNNSTTNNYYRADGQNCGNFITVSTNHLHTQCCI